MYSFQETESNPKWQCQGLCVCVCVCFQEAYSLRQSKLNIYYIYTLYVCMYVHTSIHVYTCGIFAYIYIYECMMYINTTSWLSFHVVSSSLPVLFQNRNQELIFPSPKILLRMSITRACSSSWPTDDLDAITESTGATSMAEIAPA